MEKKETQMAEKRERAAALAEQSRLKASEERARARRDELLEGPDLSNLAPWEQPGAGGLDAEDAALLRNARTKFSVKEVRKFDFVGGYGSGDLPSLGLPEIAFLGRSNVGKSSMLNCLAGPGQRPALVSKMPGRTQRINLFRVPDSKGDFVVFSDLPGYGFAKISKAGQANIGDFLNEYLTNRAELCLVCLLVDSRLGPQGADLETLTAFRALGLPHLVLATKVDKLKGPEAEANLAALKGGLGLGEDEPLLPFSSETGEGRREVWQVLQSAVLAALGEDDDAASQVLFGEPETGEWESDGEDSEGSKGLDWAQEVEEKKSDPNRPW